MIRKLVRYKIDMRKRDEILAGITEMISCARTFEPGMIDYEAYVLFDPGQFVHFMSFIDNYALRTHLEAPYTLKFMDLLKYSCIEKPQMRDLKVVNAGIS